MRRDKWMVLVAGCTLSLTACGREKLWECQTDTGAVVIIKRGDALNPMHYGGQDKDGWVWSTSRIMLCRQIPFRALAEQEQ
jgi:hypothetical protein